MPTLSLHFDPANPQDVAQAREILEHFDTARTTTLRGRSVPVLAPQQPSQSTQSLAAKAIADLWSRTGLSLREIVKASAEYEVFTLSDLSAALGEEPTAVRSRFANLGRSVKAMREAVPGAPGLYEEVERRDGIWHLRMPEPFREVVLRTDINEPYADGSLPS
jgi:hypothetical protein